MGLFRRVGRIGDMFATRLSDLIDGRESPERVLTHALREIEAAIRTTLTHRSDVWRLRLRVRVFEATLRTARSAAAQTIAGEWLAARRFNDQLRQIELWHERAAEAAARNDDRAARRALVRKRGHETFAVALADELAAAQEIGRMLGRRIEAMRLRLAVARRMLAMLERGGESSTEPADPDLETEAELEELKRHGTQ